MDGTKQSSGTPSPNVTELIWVYEEARTATGLLEGGG